MGSISQLEFEKVEVFKSTRALAWWVRLFDLNQDFFVILSLESLFCTFSALAQLFALVAVEMTGRGYFGKICHLSVFPLAAH